MNAPTNNIENLSQVFSKILFQWLGQDKIDLINADNEKRKDDSCASHDHCDPNQAMIDAYTIVYRREPFINCSAAAPNIDTDRINQAWDLAKTNKFQFHPDV